MTRFDGRLAVVTGGGSGIGRATAHRLASDGARVTIWDFSQGAGRRTAEDVGGESFLVDVRDPNSVERAAEATGRLGPVSCLVNAAGIFIVEGGVDTASIEDWDNVLSTNLRSMFLTGKFLIPLMRRALGPAIVNIASVYGLRGYADECAYDASKGGVVNLTRHMAIQYAGEGIRVNAVAPGEIETPLMRAQLKPGQDFDELKAQIADTIPMKRVGQPEEIAAVIAFLLSDDASYVTGAVVPVDGALLAG